MSRHYYDLKYPYLCYHYTDDDGSFIMFSVPPVLLAKTFEIYFHKKPKNFFDCGAAVGVIIQLAMDCGMDAYGIDIKKYPPQQQSRFYIKNQKLLISYPNFRLQDFYNSGRIQIKSILDCEPINTDIVYCNGVLTYFDEQTLPNVLSKFKNIGMLFAIHNTTEDIIAAKRMGETLGTCNKPRIIKPNKWWINTFNKNGFNTIYDHTLKTFIAIPRQR